MTSLKLIIGLGNPGPSYEHTRHNAGKWLALALAKQYQAHFKLEKKMQAELAELQIGAQVCKLALPLTFMNESGQPTRVLSQFYRIAPEEVLIIHDELDLPPGCIRLKSGGGHGGHNGLRDISTQLASTAFHRMRIGIGHPGHRDLVHQYVLSKPSIQDQQLMNEAIARGLACMPLLLEGNIAKAMEQLNRGS